MVGIHFLYKVLKESAGDLLMQVPRKWFLYPEEKRERKRIVSFLKKYGQLPKPPDSIPAGFEDQPLEYYVDELRKRYCMHLLTTIKASEVSPENVEKYLRYLYEELTNLTADVYTQHIIKPENIPSFAQQVTDTMRLNRVAGILGIPSGYSTLDRQIGGFTKGEVVVFVARMKMGKTMYLLNSVVKVAKEVATLFISMEMPLHSIMKRILALELQNPNFVSQTRIVSSFIDKRFSELNLNLHLVNGAVLRDISDLYSLVNVYRPQVVFIDGAYLLPASGYRSEWEKAKNIIEELRRFALKTNVALVCSWQLARTAVKPLSKNGEPEPEHISFTDAVAQSATAVVGIVNPDTNLNDKKLFFIMCNREGPDRVKIVVNWDWERMNFNEDSSVAVSVQEMDDDILNMAYELMEEYDE